jgi:hypothetical protein
MKSLCDTACDLFDDGPPECSMFADVYSQCASARYSSATRRYVWAREKRQAVPQKRWRHSTTKGRNVRVGLPHVPGAPQRTVRTRIAGVTEGGRSFVRRNCGERTKPDESTFHCESSSPFTSLMEPSPFLAAGKEDVNVRQAEAHNSAISFPNAGGMSVSSHTLSPILHRLTPVGKGVGDLSCISPYAIVKH